MKLSEQIKKHQEERRDLEEKLTEILDLITEVRDDLELENIIHTLCFDVGEELVDFYISGKDIHIILEYIDPFDDWDTRSDVVFPVKWLDMTKQEVIEKITKTFNNYDSGEKARRLKVLKQQAIEAGLIKE